MASAKARSILKEEEFPEEAILELAALRMEYWKSNRLSTRKDSSYEVLGAAWGPETWHLAAELPKMNQFGSVREQPFSERSFVLSPTLLSGDTLGATDAWLQRCGVAVLNMKGKKEENDIALGQDNCSVALLDNGWEVYCVMDGHGPDGHWPATRAVHALPYFLKEEECMTLLEQGHVEKALVLAFEKTQDSLEHHGWEEKVKLFISGTTASVVLRKRNGACLWVAHVGDSRVSVIHPGGCQPLQTRDHTPRIDAEHQRVTQSGCCIEVEKHEDGAQETRIFIKGKGYPGIAMTRSLGDLCVKKYGVIATPEVVEWSVEKGEDSYLLVASDGIWEYMTTQEVSQLILSELGKGCSSKKVLATLLEASKARWKQNEGSYCDDISAILISLNSPGLPDLVTLRSSSSSGLCSAGVCKACTVS